MSTPKTTRRKFITHVGIGTAALMAAPALSKAAGILKPDTTYTVGNIMDMFIKTVPGAPFPTTVDTLKAGNRDMVITGIVTAMFPTVDVIRKTADLGANFIVCHEPTFYNHTDDTDWLAGDDVYQYKADLLKQHGIAIWRNHDYIHSIVPDGVISGVVAKLGWKDFQKGSNTFLFTPAPTLKELIDQTKQKLDIEKVRYIGDLSQPCSNVLLMEGAAGGRPQIKAIGAVKPDVVFCGEISEWETAEYIRDARAEGKNISLVVLGHIASEEAGSIFMADWLKDRLTGVKVTHVNCGNSLRFA